MFGINIDSLYELCCTRVINTPGKAERIVIEVDKNGAYINRDTIAKMLYDAMFNWLVQRVNLSITKKFEKPAKYYKSIGLLDIFGFEIFKDNSFEQ